MSAMTFEEAKLEAARLDAEIKTTETVLRAFPRDGAFGLPSDAVRATPEYRAAKTAFDRAFAKLRNFNAWYTKAFKKELAAERSARRAAR